MASTEGLAFDGAENTTDGSLTARDRGILDFERDWTRHAGAKEDAVHAEFGLTPARYYQVLNALLDSPAALAYDPMLVKRLQRMREANTSARTLRAHRSDDTPS